MTKSKSKNPAELVTVEMMQKVIEDLQVQITEQVEKSVTRADFVLEMAMSADVEEMPASYDVSNQVQRARSIASLALRVRQGHAGAV